MPRPRCPPPAFGIQTRRIISGPVGPGKQLAAQHRQNPLEALSHLRDRLPIRARRAVVRRHLLNASLRFSSRATSSIVIAGSEPLLSWSSASAPRASQPGSAPVPPAVGPLRALGCLEGQFQLPRLFAGRGRLPSPRLSPRLGPPFDGLPVLRGPSDSSRPFVISSFRPRRLPLALSRRGGREVSPGKNTELHADNRRLYSRPADGYRASQLRASSPRAVRLTDASLSLGTALHLRLPPDAPSRVSEPPRRTGAPVDALVSSVWGSLRQGPKRTFTSCSAPMPGAPQRTRLRSPLMPDVRPPPAAQVHPPTTPSIEASACKH